MTGAVRVTLSCIAAMSLAVGGAGCGNDDDGSSADSDPSPPTTATALDGSGHNRERSPSPSSVLTARDAADRFAVLRDESRLAKPSSRCSGLGNAGRGSQSYLVRRQGGLYFCITVGQQAICVSTFRPRGGGHGGCFESRTQKLEKFAEGRFGVATFSTRDGDLIYATVPDGTRDASITYRDGTTESVLIEENFLGVVADKPPATVSWTTPDGERFRSEP